MRKLLALLCALILIAYAALSFAETASNTAQIHYLGETLALNYDGDAVYSFAADGYIQVTFYAYSEDLQNLYELSIEFPDTVTTGTVLTQNSESDSGIMFVHSTQNSDEYYCATHYQGITQPAEANYAITFDIAENGHYSGKLEGALLGVGETGFDWNGQSVDLTGATFDCVFNSTLPQQPDPNPFEPYPEQPYENTPDETPIPTPTPKPDLVKC